MAFFWQKKKKQGKRSKHSSNSQKNMATSTFTHNSKRTNNLRTIIKMHGKVLKISHLAYTKLLVKRRMSQKNVAFYVRIGMLGSQVTVVKYTSAIFFPYGGLKQKIRQVTEMIHGIGYFHSITLVARPKSSESLYCHRLGDKRQRKTKGAVTLFFVAVTVTSLHEVEATSTSRNNCDNTKNCETCSLQGMLHKATIRATCVATKLRDKLQEKLPSVTAP